MDLRGTPGTVVGVRPADGQMLVQVGDRQLKMPLQDGFQAGDRVLVRQLTDGRTIAEAIPSETSDGASPFDVFAPRSTELGTFLDYVEKNVPTNSPETADAKALLKSLVPEFANDQLPTATVRQLSAQLFDILLNSDKPELQDIGTRLQQTLAKLYPDTIPAPSQAAWSRPLAQTVQDLLGSLAANDFKAASNLLESLAKAMPSVATSDLSALQRLSAPLHELEAWGSPDTLDPKALQSLCAQVDQALSIPVPATLRASMLGAAQSAGSNSSITAQIVSVSETSLKLAIPVDSGSAKGNPQTLELPMPAGSPWTALLKAGTTIAMAILPEGNPAAPQGLRLTPQPDSAYLPAAELPAYVATGAPLTANLVDAREFLTQYDPDPNPAQVARFAETLHALDLLLPHGEALTDEQKDLALRTMLTEGRALKSPDLQGLAQYKASADPEPDMFKALPAKVRDWLASELERQGPKPLKAKDLQDLLQRALETPDKAKTAVQPAAPATTAASQATVATPPPTLNTNERDLVQAMQKQLQWTQRDQDSRHPDDRQETFYFYNGGELHKARIQVRKDPQSKNGRPGEESMRRFFVETRTALLGKVHVDFMLRAGKVQLDFADASGKAEQAVQAERPALAKDLEDIGLELSSLVYKLLQQDQAPQQTRAAPKVSGGSGLLDLRA